LRKRDTALECTGAPLLRDQNLGAQFIQSVRAAPSRGPRVVELVTVGDDAELQLVAIPEDSGSRHVRDGGVDG
jgi:hypothetical protein